MSKTVVLVLGGGNASHVAAGLAASRENTEVRVLTTYADEAERWEQKLQQCPMSVCLHEKQGEVTVTSKPYLVTKDPAKAVPGADIIIFCVPAFSHQGYFEALKPHISPNATIVGFPGQPGFEFQCLDVLGDKAKTIHILNFESLPWACRMSEFGRSATVIGLKVHLQGSLIRAKGDSADQPGEVLRRFQKVIGPETTFQLCHSYIEPILDTKSIVHPPIMYAKWKDWDGKPVSEKPAFYQGLDTKQIEYLHGISAECVAAARAISAKRPDIDLSDVVLLEKCYRKDYKDTIGDPTSLYTIMRSNTAYDGLVHPMEKTSAGFVPDFTTRYLREDVPYGIVVTKGIALIAGVDTPCHDMVLAWCQEKLGKEYLVGKELTGKDIKETRCPQRYGYKTLDDLLSIS